MPSDLNRLTARFSITLPAGYPDGFLEGGTWKNASATAAAGHHCVLVVGFDDATKGKGRVDCRVFADDKELYADPDLRADGPPKVLALPVVVTCGGQSGCGVASTRE